MLFSRVGTTSFTGILNRLHCNFAIPTYLYFITDYSCTHTPSHTHTPCPYTHTHPIHTHAFSYLYRDLNADLNDTQLRKNTTQYSVISEHVSRNIVHNIDVLSRRLFKNKRGNKKWQRAHTPRNNARARVPRSAVIDRFINIAYRTCRLHKVSQSAAACWRITFTTLSFAHLSYRYTYTMDGLVLGRVYHHRAFFKWQWS